MPLQPLTPQQLEDLSEMHPVWRQFYTAYFQAPKDMQDFAMSDEAVALLENILTKQHGLDLDIQASTAARITWDVFFGIIPLKSFIQDLVEKVPLPIEEASAIAGEINEAIFQPVKESLMEVHGITTMNHGEGSTEHGVEDTNKQPLNYSSMPPTIHDSSTAIPETPEEPQAPRSHAPDVARQDALEQEYGQVIDQKRAEEEAAQKRAELLQRLKEHTNYEPSISNEGSSPASSYVLPVPEPQPTPEKPNSSNPPQNGNGARAKLTAWNGKTIDLTRIPPRREANKKNGVPIEQDGVRYVKLVKSKDGYWYEV